LVTMFPVRKSLFIFGIVLLFVFVLTGQYLEHVLRPHYGDAAAPRMMARASHLYLLFISLMLMLASLIPFPMRRPPKTSGTRATLTWTAILMGIGYGLLAASSGFLIASFFLEHSGDLDNRMWALVGCISALAGGILIVVGAISGGAFRADAARKGIGPYSNSGRVD
jgi:hypothetical protein